MQPFGAEVALGRYPMAIKINGTDYKGVLYNFSGTITLASETNYREPDVLTSYGYDDTVSNYTNSGITGITTSAQFKTQLQNEYNQMVASVVSKGGFYVGRYETSLNNGDIQSKPNVTPISSINWYNMYQKQKLYERNNSIEGMISAMVYGSQWDQIMIWMRDIKNSNAFSSPYIYDSTNMGWYSNNSGSYIHSTGTLASAKVKNIFDMAGNTPEWSQDICIINGYGFHGRCARRGNLQLYCLSISSKC